MITGLRGTPGYLQVDPHVAATVFLNQFRKQLLPLGEAVGLLEGLALGLSVGENDRVGLVDGLEVVGLGVLVGLAVWVGTDDTEGAIVGLLDAEGLLEGLSLGLAVGEYDLDGLAVGLGVAGIVCG